MTIDEMIASPEADFAPEPYSAGWWAERSTDELRDIIRRGHPMGPLFEGAAVETERRARAHDRTDARAADAQAVENQRTRRVSLEGLLLLLLVAFVMMVLLR
jgi:hypothetical protein